MLFESEWSDDDIAAPVWVTDDPEDEMFIDLGDRMRSPTDLRLNQSGDAPDRCDSAKSPHRRRWISPLTAIFSELWSRLHRRRELRHINAAWAMLDDRTLKDIGISQLEVEYAINARHWSGRHCLMRHVV